jgi:hypothetical protein
MKRSERISALVWVVAGLAAVSGCTLQQTQLGTLQVDWSIAGRRSGLTCPYFRADSIKVSLQGDATESFTQDCNAFATSIGVVEGTYLGSARLLDHRGYPLTTSVDLGVVSVFPYATSFVSVEFPADSFF